MKTLHLTVTKKWFDLIASGSKRKEYRVIKRYWIARLLSNIEYLVTIEDVTAVGPRFKAFDKVVIKNGYSKHSRTIELEHLGTYIEQPPEGTVKGELAFVILLGEELSRNF